MWMRCLMWLQFEALAISLAQSSPARGEGKASMPIDIALVGWNRVNLYGSSNRATEP